VYGSYLLEFGLTPSAGLNLNSGKPLTASPPTRLSETGARFRSRHAARDSKLGWVSDAYAFSRPPGWHAAYSLKVGGRRRRRASSDVFNIFTVDGR